MVDAEYQTNGLLQKAMEVVDRYINLLNIRGLERRVFHPEGSNPLVVYKIEPIDLKPGTKNIMVYGHLDK